MPATLASRKTKSSLPTNRTPAATLPSIPRRRRSETDPVFQALLDQPVEYIPSPEFERPELTDAILDAAPVSDRRSTMKAPEGTPAYLAELYAIPLLEPKQEFHLFRQMNFWKHRAELLRRQMLEAGVTPARRRRFEEHLAHATRLRNDIVQANLRLVVSIAKTMVDEANRLDDLISDGNVPLVRAVEIFDFTRGLRFSTYATWAVRNCLFRSSPRNRKWQQRFKTGSETEFLGLADEREPAAEPTFDEPPAAELIAELLRDLPQRDRTVVEARFGLGRRKATAKFREIAGELDISTERARQLLTRAMDRLRDLILERTPDLAPAGC